MKSTDELYSVSQPEVVGTDALARLASVVRERLYPFVAGAVRDCHAAEDILQDVMSVLVERVHLLRRSECLWPWVYRVAWSKIQDHFRQHSRLRRISVATIPSEPAADPLDAMIRREAIERLVIALGQLNPRCRTVLYLRFCEQMPYGEIASVMHSTPGRIRVQFHRAKRLLRDSLLSSCA